MQNPIVSMAQESFVLINHHSHSLTMQVGSDFFPLSSLICSFQQDGEDLNAAVIAPHEDHQQLARRVVSFLGAYMRVGNILKLEHDILACIRQCLRNHPHG